MNRIFLSAACQASSANRDFLLLIIRRSLANKTLLLVHSPRWVRQSGFVVADNAAVVPEQQIAIGEYPGSIRRIEHFHLRYQRNRQSKQHTVCA
jgi:hypothetical protein